MIGILAFEDHQNQSVLTFSIFDMSIAESGYLHVKILGKRILPATAIICYESVVLDKLLYIFVNGQILTVELP